VPQRTLPSQSLTRLDSSEAPYLQKRLSTGPQFLNPEMIIFIFVCGM